MISKEKTFQLISMYLYISDIYESDLQFSCERFSNNDNPEFSDQEIITLFLFSIKYEHKYKIKHIYQFAKDYLLSWFPKLPSYVAFTTRLNRLSEAFKILLSKLLNTFDRSQCSSVVSLLDSMPIITCSGKRNGKVATELTDKSYCSTKGIWYYGLKLHILGFKRNGKLPLPESIVLTKASENDLNVFKQNWSEMVNRYFYGDKIYFDPEFFKDLFINKNSVMCTPVKAIKGMTDELKSKYKAADDLFSTAVSRVRQPIESLFNWLIEKTNIQRASTVRSTNGLLVHVFGRLAAAYIFI
jgi:hypothetical protein